MYSLLVSKLVLKVFPVLTSSESWSATVRHDCLFLYSSDYQTGIDWCTKKYYGRGDVIW